MPDINFKKIVEINFNELLEKNFQEILTIVSCTHCSTFQDINRQSFYPANTYLFKVNNKNTRNRCETCSKLTPFSTASIVDSGQVNVSWVRGIFLSTDEVKYRNIFL